MTDSPETSAFRAARDALVRARTDLGLARSTFR